MVPENPFHPEFRPNPYPLYHYLRSTAPVHRTMFGWLLTRHADCLEVLEHEQRFSHDFANHAYYRRWVGEGWEPGPVHSFLAGTLTSQDPPAHTHSRAQLSAIIEPGLDGALQPNIEGHVDRLVASAAGSGGMDAVADFAYVLPLAIVGEWLGIPSEDLDKVRAWTAQLTPVLDGLTMREADAQATAAELRLRGYLSRLIDERRARPRSDVLSAMLEIREDGSAIGSWDVATNCMFLLVAAHEVTANMLGNGLLALLRHPDQMQQLRERPELAPAAVEEVLRYDSPLQMSSRATLEQVDFGGVAIPKGDDVILVIGAANRDPVRFREPDNFDISRDASGHLAFTAGLHACLGAPLARRIGATAFRSLAVGLPRLRLASDSEPEWKVSPTMRGLRSLPVVI